MVTNIRLYEEKDYKEIKMMIKSLYIEDSDGELITDYKIHRTLTRIDCSSEIGFIYVIEIDQQLVGYSILINYWSNEYGGMILNIDEIYVKKGWRNQGIATNFFNYLMDTHSDQIVAFQLEVTPLNRRALEYYQRLGFEKIKNTRLIYKL